MKQIIYRLAAWTWFRTEDAKVPADHRLFALSVINPPVCHCTFCRPSSGWKKSAIALLRKAIGVGAATKERKP